VDRGGEYDGDMRSAFKSEEYSTLKKTRFNLFYLKKRLNLVYKIIFALKLKKITYRFKFLFFS